MQSIHNSDLCATIANPTVKICLSRMPSEFETLQNSESKINLMSSKVKTLWHLAPALFDLRYVERLFSHRPIRFLDL